MQLHSSVQVLMHTRLARLGDHTYLGTYAGPPPLPHPPLAWRDSPHWVPIAALSLSVSALKSLPNACLAPRGSLKKLPVRLPPCPPARLSRLLFPPQLSFSPGTCLD